MSAYSDRVIADGASNYWRLGETAGLTAVDSVGGKTGTISGGVTLNQAGAVLGGDAAMTFDGVDDQITTPSVALPASCTIEAWQKASAGTFRPLVTSGVFRVTVADTYGYVESGATTASGTPGTVVPGKWHHHVYVFTGSTVTFYVDGVFDRTQPFALVLPTGALTFGFASGLAALTGSLDEIAIYPRALTPAEILAHYDLGKIPPPQTYAERVVYDGASNFWRLGETSGTTAVDIVSAKHGTISGGVTLGQPSPLQDGTSAMLFNGTTGKILSSTVGATFGTGALTFECWAKITAAAAAMLVDTKNGTFSFPGMALLMDTTRLYVTLQDAAANITQTPGWNWTASINQWLHLTAVLSRGSPDRLLLYVNGVQVDAINLTVSGGNVSSTVGLGIGSYSNGSGAFFPGALDEVAIYPRALSASEVAAHYAVSSVPEPRDLNTGLYTYLLGVFGVSAGTSYAERVKSDGATNHWRLGETSGVTAVDAIGGANGTISGGVTLNQAGAVLGGDGSMLFNGSTGKVATAASLPIVITVEGWIKTTVVAQRPVVSNYGTPGGHHCCVHASGKLGYFGSTASATGVKVVADGVWHHVVWVIDATHCVLYVDGQYDATGLEFPATAVGSTNPSLGWGNAEFFSGLIDDVAIYPRALTAAEIAAHYSLGRSGLSGGNDLTTLITRYLATLTGDMTARWKQMEKNAGF